MAFYEFLTTCRRAEGAELRSADCSVSVRRRPRADLGTAARALRVSRVELLHKEGLSRQYQHPNFPCAVTSTNPTMLGLELQNLPLRRDLEVKSASPNNANLLMCRQWWKVCWIYGDQENYYRQLYGKRQSSSATVVTVQREVSTLCSE